MEEAVSYKIQELALCGIKSEKRYPRQYASWFHLLLYLAWQGWNLSLLGGNNIVPLQMNNDIAGIKKNHGIRDRDIAKHFISTDITKVLHVMAKEKSKRYPNDLRFIQALEFTPQGTLRAYTR